MFERFHDLGNVSLDLIKGSPKEKREKVHFLTLAAFLDLQYISERYFRAYSTIDDGIEWKSLLRNVDMWDSDRLGDFLAEFRRLSLIQVLNCRDNEYAFSIHPLICDWMKFRKGVETRSRITELTNMLVTFLETHNFDDLSLEVNQERLRRRLGMLRLGSKQMKSFSKTLTKLYLLCLETQLGFLQVSTLVRACTGRLSGCIEGGWKEWKGSWGLSTPKH
jgi:hypothetical protein